jgi:hypothetical protein
VAVHGAARDGSRGRTATHPLEVPARGWKDVLFRVWKNIGKDRVLLVGAGVTFYIILALFPAIAALVALYGVFADPTTITSHLDSIADLVPAEALEVIRDQITRVASQGRTTLGFTFMAGLLASLWSANAGVKSLFDALNLVYNEPEKRSFVWLNVISLTFTVVGILFRTRCNRGDGGRPPGIEFHRTWRCDRDDNQARAVASFVDCRNLGDCVSLSLWTEPRKASMALDHIGQRRRGSLLDHRFDSICLVRGECR